MKLDKAIELVDETLWKYLDYGDVEEEFMQAWEVIKEHLTKEGSDENISTNH